MDELEIDEILEALRTKKIEPRVIIDKLKNRELNLGPSEILEIASNFEDEDKINLLKEVWNAPISIIGKLETEENKVRAVELLDSDKQKIKAILKYLKSDESRLAALETIKDKDKALAVKISLSREGFKKYFLGEEIKYQEIGLDDDITFGIEIESLGEKSKDILEIGELNGTIVDLKEIERGKIVKRRKW